MAETQQLSPEQRKELEEKLKSMSPEELLQFQKQQCLFCQILGGKIPAKKVYEDEQCLAILDIRPATRGHLLLLPKEHSAIMPQLKDELIGHLFMVAKKLSHQLLKTLRVEGTSLFIANGLVAGQKAQHFMIHLIPRKEGDHILEAAERPSPADENVRIAVANRLSQLFGLKKEIVPLPEDQVPSPEEKRSEGKHISTRKALEPAAKPSPRKKRKSLPLESIERKEEQTSSNETVTLDDIANLFK